MLLLGACAHAPTTPNPQHERITRIIEERPDTSVGDVATKAAGDRDNFIPEGIDLARFELPMQYNERVQEYIELFSGKRRSSFTIWLRRMGRYRDVIEEKLAQHGLPRELVYLALIESAYEPNAASHASAVGLWQFMAGTARAEGLEVSEYVDERRDPIRSTDAALRHLSGLYNHFGSWYLTAAAYNSGSGRIGRLLKEHGLGKHDDSFWQLHDVLPRETRDYVPQLLAATIVGEHRDHFGFQITPESPVRFETVTVPAATDLRAVARAAGASVEQIKALNAHYIKGMTPPDRSADVRVPVGASAEFAAAFQQIPAAERTRSLGSTHIVQPGETLSGIARKYGTSVDAIQKVNRIVRPDLVAAGRKLVIPG